VRTLDGVRGARNAHLMHEQRTYTEGEIARVVGYARVRDDAPSPRGRKADARRRRVSLPRLRSGAPRLAFA